MLPGAPARRGFSAVSPCALRAQRSGHYSGWPRNKAAGISLNTSVSREWTRSRGTLSILEHFHLRGQGPSGLVPYGQAGDAQEEHRSKFLSWKALSEKGNELGSVLDAPKPRLLSFEAEPTFTLGRRQEDLTAEQTSCLQSPLKVGLTQSFIPQVMRTNRGGLTTYHGPGQIVLWPIVDMHSRLYPKYGVASYANHLETTTQRLLSELFGIQTYIARDEPGVWVSAPTGQPRKIAALGVHHRRHVTALGIAVNVDIPVTGDGSVNPWARFVPCGLDGKLVTSVAAEFGTDSSMGWDLEDLAGRWAALFEEGMLDESKRSRGGGEVEDRLRR
ncbi:hypothetical protein EsDP_00006589 [Epichloe bromicola]|uniref:lipoyl(octanoyl) transferase n=1 Tax=Epichloe bromicola TaxID=79588 RepID=A0ABQ0CY18_9HYPO